MISDGNILPLLAPIPPYSTLKLLDRPFDAFMIRMLLLYMAVSMMCPKVLSFPVKNCLNPWGQFCRGMAACHQRSSEDPAGVEMIDAGPSFSQFLLSVLSFHFHHPLAQDMCYNADSPLINGPRQKQLWCQDKSRFEAQK